MKTCIDCEQEKKLDCYYKNSILKDKKMSRCIDCFKKFSNNIEFYCLECNKLSRTSNTEINKGGGKVCSRTCYYKYQKKTRPSGEKSWAWKGDKVGKEALHNWVIKNLGRPMKCEHCKTIKAKKFEWANKSQKYRRELDDWIRLCTKCHAKYDYPTRHPKWVESVKKHGWKTKQTLIK